MCRRLVDAPPVLGEKNNPVRLFAGSGMRRDVWRQLVDRFGPVGVLELYASTEANAVLANARGKKIGSVGRPLPGSPEVAVAAWSFADDDFVRDGAGHLIRARLDEPGMLVARARRARARRRRRAHRSEAPAARRVRARRSVVRHRRLRRGRRRGRLLVRRSRGQMIRHARLGAGRVDADRGRALRRARRRAVHRRRPRRSRRPGDRGPDRGDPAAAGHAARPRRARRPRSPRCPSTRGRARCASSTRSR